MSHIIWLIYRPYDMDLFNFISVRSILMLYPLLGFHEIFVNCMHLKTGKRLTVNQFLTGSITSVNRKWIINYFRFRYSRRWTVIKCKYSKYNGFLRYRPSLITSQWRHLITYYVMTSCGTFEIVLASFEGFLVTFMYCFLNLEVQTELQRSFRYWWWRADGQERFRRWV